MQFLEHQQGHAEYAMLGQACMNQHGHAGDSVLL